MKKSEARGTWYHVVRMDFKILLALLLLGIFVGAAVLSVRAMEGDGVQVPVVMYHSLLRDEGRLGDYVISPGEFESDMTYLKEKGYTTVLMEDLIAYTKGGDLPEKPILITFDDGYYNNYCYGFEIAQRLGVKFVLSPIGYYADAYTDTPDENAYYSHATWPQLEEMSQSGLVEIQNHSYNLHKSKERLGTKKLPSESPEDYKELLTQDLLLSQEKIEAHTGKRPTTFVYPFGAVSAGEPDLVKELGFQASLSCEEKTSVITRNPDSLYDLGRYLRKTGISSSRFFEQVMKLPVNTN